MIYNDIFGFKSMSNSLIYKLSFQPLIRRKKCIKLMLIGFIGYNHSFKGIAKTIFQKKII
jgi:hypothetical protein